VNQIFNEDIKRRFIDETYDNEGTKKIVEYVFYYAYGNEVPLGKDLYNFTLDEIGDVIANGRPKSTNVAATRGNIIYQYIDWAIKNNLRTSNIHPMQELDREWYGQFIDKNIKQFISKMELDEIENQLVNAQDRVVLRLLWLGVSGKEYNELRNLRLSDISDGRLHLNDADVSRVISLDDETYAEDTMSLLRKANGEFEYENKNGTVEAERWSKSKLIDSEFIVKNVARGRAKAGEPVTQFVIMNRIKMIAELFGLPDLTPKSITRSGMIYMAHQILEEKRAKGLVAELEYEDFEKIGIRYNLSTIDVNGYIYYNTTYMKQFINMDNIRKLYN